MFWFLGLLAGSFLTGIAVLLALDAPSRDRSEAVGPEPPIPLLTGDQNIGGKGIFATTRLHPTPAAGGMIHPDDF